MSCLILMATMNGLLVKQFLSTAINSLKVSKEVLNWWCFSTSGVWQLNIYSETLFLEGSIHFDNLSFNLKNKYAHGWSSVLHLFVRQLPVWKKKALLKWMPWENLMKCTNFAFLQELGKGVEQCSFYFMSWRQQTLAKSQKRKIIFKNTL